MDLNKLRNIIEKKVITPTIINEDSNFVVVTYWWGRDVKNQNTSRPCISFFEDIFKKLQKMCLENLGTNRDKRDIQIYHNLENIMEKQLDKTFIDINAREYLDMIFEQLDLLPTEADIYNKAVIMIEKRKETNKTPKDFELKDKNQVANLLKMILLEAIKLVKSSYFKINDTNFKITQLKNKLTNKQMVIELKQKIDDESNVIKKVLNTKLTYEREEMKEFDNMSLYEILHKELRFLSPMTYNDMITKWEKECKKFTCNYMAVEYSEFSLPGGYQMAINAKPLFIKKALEVCASTTGKSRAILYIDGDMFIRKYPKIFDMTDIDFMARGWSMDPRSSYQMDESIVYDPYTFETSGGTMFFSQSIESKILINKWIEISESKYQIGKADDRILSLLFNTYKFLCPMKIIQLPIEYLWLTLDYDKRLMNLIYDWDKNAMQETIFIEHSECLTTEDTAAGSGASSDRTPKFYGYLQQNIEAVSEQFHEYLMFPSLDMVSSFKHYLQYMSDLQYFSDEEPIPIKKGFTFENPKDNEQPLYITKYEDKWGNFKYLADKSLTYNDVAEININRVEKMNISELGLVHLSDKLIEINNFTNLMKEDNPTKYNHAKIISLIIKLLKEDNTVIYNPKIMLGYDSVYYDLLIEKSQSQYNRMEFIFVPELTSSEFQSSNFFYKPKIRTNQAIMFRPSDIFIKFLMMFLSIDDLSDYLDGGSYEFMSRVRVGYLINKTHKPKQPCTPCIDNNTIPNDPNSCCITTGGAITNPTQDIDLYMEGIDILYTSKGGRGTGRGKRSNKKLRAKRETMKIIHSKRKTMKKHKHRGKKGKKTLNIKKIINRHTRKG